MHATPLAEAACGPSVVPGPARQAGRRGATHPSHLSPPAHPRPTPHASAERPRTAPVPLCRNRRTRGSSKPPAGCAVYSIITTSANTTPAQ